MHQSYKSHVHVHWGDGWCSRMFFCTWGIGQVFSYRKNFVITSSLIIQWPIIWMAGNHIPGQLSAWQLKSSICCWFCGGVCRKGAHQTQANIQKQPIWNLQPRKFHFKPGFKSFPSLFELTPLLNQLNLTWPMAHHLPSTRKSPTSAYNPRYQVQG